MVFTRPIVDQEISAADFGQPVYDGMARAGFTRTGGAFSATTTISGIPLPDVREQVGPAWSANGSSNAFTCPLAGVYVLTACGFAGNNVPSNGTFIGIQIDGIMRARDFLRASVAAYATYTAVVTLPLNVGQVVVMCAAMGSGTMTWGTVPWPGLNSDGPAPCLSAWRVNI